MPSGPSTIVPPVTPNLSITSAHPGKTVVASGSGHRPEKKITAILLPCLMKFWKQ